MSPVDAHKNRQNLEQDKQIKKKIYQKINTKREKRPQLNVQSKQM